MGMKKGTWRFFEVLSVECFALFLFSKCWNSHISLKPPAFISGSSVISRCTNMRHAGVQFHPHNRAARKWCHCISTVLWCVRCAYVCVCVFVFVCILNLCLSGSNFNTDKHKIHILGHFGTSHIRLNLWAWVSIFFHFISIDHTFIKATFLSSWDLNP